MITTADLAPGTDIYGPTGARYTVIRVPLIRTGQTVARRHSDRLPVTIPNRKLALFTLTAPAAPAPAAPAPAAPTEDRVLIALTGRSVHYPSVIGQTATAYTRCAPYGRMGASQMRLRFATGYAVDCQRCLAAGPSVPAA